MLFEIKTFLIAMAPIGELRISIPIAIEIYNLSPCSAFLFSVLGNILPGIFLLWRLKPISQYLSRHFNKFNSLFLWFFERNKKKHCKKFEQCKELALVILVAIPFPFTGVWTASICAFIFKVPFRKALP